MQEFNLLDERFDVSRNFRTKNINKYGDSGQLKSTKRKVSKIANLNLIEIIVLLAYVSKASKTPLAL